ncbi:exodeoxyribonuclease VII small subunit [Fundidesulfovibrio soli]|uniref:exodeoxyribonuclease VII small subunit n=1 Tax=Fundidesulfovibrio soli TaxID=2922716 RepID=UPI001FAEB51B|nr:exodeoxyribonuclease VII small subunit [Fundidesulfovibrio soli]
MSVDKNSFENNIERLQRIVEQLESGEPALEKGVDLYKEGMALAAACRKQLDKARLTVNKVTPEGIVPFTPADGEEN